MKALGHVFKYGDNVDTDVIIPARYLNSFDGKELASHAMVDIDPEFASGRKLCDCRDICQNLLSKCNQYRTPDHRMSRSSEWD